MLAIRVAIVDNPLHKIGVNVTGKPKGGNGQIAFTGRESNTFTGNVTVSGENTVLELIKENGATAIRSDLTIRDGGLVGLFMSNQIADTSSVRLHGGKNEKSPVLFFSGFVTKNVSEKIHDLTVEGRAVFDFNFGGDATLHGQRFLYLDNLIAGGDSELIIRNWIEGKDRFLVRKDSEFLEHSLKKLDFEGYDRNTIATREFNKDYVEIWAQLPEPSTYGAVSIGLGMCVGLMRGRSKGRRLQP